QAGRGGRSLEARRRGDGVVSEATAEDLRQRQRRPRLQVLLGDGGRGRRGRGRQLRVRRRVQGPGRRRRDRLVHRLGGRITGAADRRKEATKTDETRLPHSRNRPLFQTGQLAIGD